MIRILVIVIFPLLVGCQNEDPVLDGFWSMKLHIQNKEIPFQLNFKANEKVDLINGPEIITLGYDVKNQIVLIPILNFNALLELEWDNSSVKGHWIKPDREPPFRVPISGTKAPAKLKIPKLEIASKWKINLLDGDKTKEGLLLFTHKKDYTFASVLTTTGDYRFLTPFKRGDKLVLYGFDGVFAFYFEGNIKDGAYAGTMYSGRTWNQKFEAVPDKDFELPDPMKATTISGGLDGLVLPRLDGKTETVINERNKKKVKVIQIFGSWCPNCIDEARFVREWREQNPDKDVSFAIVSFERAPNKKAALKQLKKTKELYNIDYPIYVGGHTEEDKVQEVFPKLENFISFPTMLFVDKNNRVREIHAGFSGPATGKYYEKFIMDFNALINKLLKED